MNHKIEVGTLRPLEYILKEEITDAISNVGGGKMSTNEVIGVLEEVKLTMYGVFNGYKDEDDTYE